MYQNLAIFAFLIETQELKNYNLFINQLQETHTIVYLHKAPIVYLHKSSIILFAPGERGQEQAPQEFP